MKVYMLNNITVVSESCIAGILQYTVKEYAQALHVLQKIMDVSYPVELQLIGDSTMSAYGKRYSGVSAPTNILSFEAEKHDGIAMLMLSLHTAHRESILYGQEYNRYIWYLLTHGFVHSAGFDHGEEMDNHCNHCYHVLLTLF